MFLQLAIGPVFFFIFQTAAISGFWTAETGVLGVFIIDALFIFLAVAGVGAVIEKKNIKSVLKFAGAIVLLVFGASTILNGFHVRFLPAMSLQGGDPGSTFLHALVLTASSPITILFWAGIFSSRIAESNMHVKGIRLFALGALLATLIFMSLASLLGSLIGGIIPPLAAQCLNAAVGIILMIFGIKILLKKI
jgi:threonine/homoserine/homoserine lactone efflux protein